MVRLVQLVRGDGRNELRIVPRPLGDVRRCGVFRVGRHKAFAQEVEKERFERAQERFDAPPHDRVRKHEKVQGRVANVTVLVL